MNNANSATTSPAKLFTAFNEAELNEDQTTCLFQELIDTGQAWKLEGSIGREAMSLIKSGHCMLGPTGFHDYYGNYVPSRSEVKAGTPGSAEFVRSSGMS
jgi:hypothetical protein